MSNIKNLEVNYDMLSDEKKHDLYLRKLATGEIQGPPTGKPSQDRPWLLYYNPKKYKTWENKTAYQEMYDNNLKNTNNVAIEYFGSKIKFNKLFEKIDDTSKALVASGVKKGDNVIICSAGIPEMIYSFYALSKIGAVANMISPFFDKVSLIKRIEESESDMLIIMDTFYDDLKDTIKKSRIKKVVIVPTLNSSFLYNFKKKYKIKKEKSNNFEILWNDFVKKYKNNSVPSTEKYEKDMPLVMVYSSGTTGASKGILLTNDSFKNSIHAYSNSGIDVSSNQKFYQIIPPWFSTGLCTSIHLPLTNRATLFMDPRFERNVFIKNIIKAKPNYTIAPTSMYEGFLDENFSRKYDLSFFNYPFEGGEPLDKDVRARIENIFKVHNSNSKLRVGYGQCECGATITTEIQGIEHPSGTVGIPLPGIVVGIFDDDYNEMFYNQRGNILVNTPCSMKEYYKNEVETRKYFYTDEKGVKWNCTGDIGYMDEKGNLFVEGRASDYSLINGDKIYNFDIEKIIKTVPFIKLCDVIQNINGEMCVHLILEHEIADKKELFSKIQHAIYSETCNINCVPYLFKIRNSFPYAKSGKRDINSLKKENSDFIVYYDSEIFSQKIKKI